MGNASLSPTEAISKLKSMGFSQQKIAEYIGSSQGYISRIENFSIVLPSYAVVDALRDLVEKMEQNDSTINNCNNQKDDMNKTDIDALLEEHSKVLQEIQNVKRENQDLKDCFKNIAEGIDAVLADMDNPIKRLEMILHDLEAPKHVKDFLLTMVKTSTLNTRTELDILKGIIKKFK